MIPLDIDLSADPAMRAMFEKQWSAVYSLHRAIQRDARDRCRAYDAWDAGRGSTSLKGSKKTRNQARNAVRERLGLSQTALTNAAYAHLDNSGHLRNWVTKAQALHHAAAVWEPVNRHLFPDASGNFFGTPGVTGWWDFRRLVGRARSHTTARKWETFRLVGTLQGHLFTYAANAVAGLSVEQVRQVAPSLLGQQVFAQPGALPVPAKPKSWWMFDGPLTVVFTREDGDLILPVRLPSGAGKFDRLAHFLANPDLWHKIDMVRIRDRRAPGGWRYQAHLTVLTSGYQSPSTIARRAAVPVDRLAGLDANVANIAAVSMPGPTLTALDDNSLRVDYVTPTPAMRARGEAVTLKAKRANRKMDRSRRAANTGQYAPSKKQQARAQRRAALGLPTKTVEVPGGKRDSNSRNIPKQAYRRDNLTPAYRRARADKAALQSAEAQRKDHAARLIAADLTARHGDRWVVEDVNIASWMRLWGGGIAATTPGRVIAALRREVAATGGTWNKASTTNTWLSQRCLCGRRSKKPLSQRWHSCPCGIEADRDVLAAALATTIVFTDPENPATAQVSPQLIGVLRRRITAQQEGRVRSTITLDHSHGTGGDGSRHQTASAGHHDSAAQPRIRRTRKGPPRRRRNGRTTSGTQPPDF